jgi:3-phenylpropionate/trans-cinnamate dioxygenase ferredoxin reductase component
MTADRRIVVVGANLTGAAAVTTLRDEGFDGPITMIGAEPHVPYERPPLSKEYLRGEMRAEEARVHPLEWYEGHDVDLRLGTLAVRLDSSARRVVLEGGEAMPYDEVLMATGGRVRPLGVPGHDVDGVFGLRTVEDADRIRAVAQPGATAVIVGGGFIGCEVAASLRALDVDVHVVEILDAPMLLALGPTVAAVFEAIHRDHGVEFHVGEAVTRFEGTGWVEAVVTDSGLRLECDLAVVGIGITPNTDLVDETDVVVGNGIVVDERCRTNVAGVYAAGDVANHFHPLFGRRMRVEHWDNALKQGAAAARAMLGHGGPFADPHWFWSDQYDHNLQMVGDPLGADDPVIRGSLEDRDFVAFYLRDGIVRAVASLDRPKDVRRATPLVAGARRVDPSTLSDDERDLRELVESSKSG